MVFLVVDHPVEEGKVHPCILDPSAYIFPLRMMAVEIGDDPVHVFPDVDPADGLTIKPQIFPHSLEVTEGICRAMGVLALSSVTDTEFGVVDLFQEFIEFIPCHG